MTINNLKRSTWVKICIIIVLLLILGLSPWYAEYEKPINGDNLPTNALNFIKTHFPEEKIAFAKKENDYFILNYEVILSGGVKIEFNRSGDWTKVNTKYKTVPSAIIPEQILNYLKDNFPNAQVKEINKKRREYEVELNNSLELKFDNKEFFLTHYDD